MLSASSVDAAFRISRISSADRHLPVVGGVQTSLWCQIRRGCPLTESGKREARFQLVLTVFLNQREDFIREQLDRARFIDSISVCFHFHDPVFSLHAFEYTARCPLRHLCGVCNGGYYRWFIERLDDYPTRSRPIVVSVHDPHSWEFIVYLA